MNTARRILLPGLVLLVLVFAAGGYYYYKTTFVPKHFITSFLEELDYKGAANIKRDFFLRRYEVTPSVTWEEFVATIEDTTTSAESWFSLLERSFPLWSSVYLHGVEGYADVTLSSPEPTIMTDEEFRDWYKGVVFSDTRMESVDIEGDGLYAVIYTKSQPNSALLRLGRGASRKWALIARRGKSGWRITNFGPVGD